MVKTIPISAGVTLRCISDFRFKHGCLSVQLVRPMAGEEAALNALLPAVLLRGCEGCHDLRQITLRLDELYGAGISACVRRIGDRQTTGLYCSFIEDRFALEGDQVLAPVIRFLGQLLREPVLEQGRFREDYVGSEKKNLVSTIESQRNDKRAYAMERLLANMCREDSFGIPRLGEPERVEEITAQSLYGHYTHILRTSPIEIFYVGSAPARQVAELVRPLFADLDRQVMELPPQTPFRDGGGGEYSQRMDVNQGKLCMGFVTPTTLRDPGFAAMQILNLVFGGGMTSKLFMNIREKQSLCYAIGTGYHGSKGLVTLSAGIDFSQEEPVRREILAQLDACARGEITPQELRSAKEAMRSSLLATEDSPGALEGYYATAALSGLSMTVQEYICAVEETTLEQVVTEAQKLRPHSVFFLKGAEV